ncbi:MAG: FAD:protein FMN transferase [Culturomica sp.]|jgi:thiamine biosynthesis lipoprotein|nr:FAD:protein FMN transferase [Culturomica sp.]
MKTNGWRMVLFIWVLAGCARPEYRTMEGNIYGTYYRVRYQAAVDLSGEVLKQIEQVNASLSMFDTASVVSGLNRGTTDRVDSLFVKMFRTAFLVHQATNGAFDITVAPLVNAWGFGYKQRMLPSESQVDSLLSFVGLEKMRLEGERLIRPEGMEIDASSIAKGLGVDLAAECLEQNDVENYLVDIGGEVRVKGRNPRGTAWRVGIDSPVEHPEEGRQVRVVVSLTAGSLATSGNYRNFYLHEGKKYGHTIDPRSGYPVQQELLSATVYAQSCMLADAYATAFMVLGLEKSRAIAEGTPDLEVCFIYDEKGEERIWMTDKFRTFVCE